MKQRKLRINFESDWHIGSGAGIPGSVDRQILRDRNGLPYVPAKTLTGILRDAAEWLAFNNAPGCSPDLLKSLFGTQPKTYNADGIDEPAQKARLSVRPGRIPRPLCSRLIDDPGLRDALFLVQPHVKVSRKTGRAEDAHLFSLELVRAGIPLESDVFLDEPTDCDETFLDTVIKAVRRIGGKRRRGAGKCRLEWVEQWSDPCTLSEKPTNCPTMSNEAWFRIPLKLEALEALQISRETLGNTVESRDFIPGYLLLPHVAGSMAPGAGRWIARGDIQVSNLTPDFEGQAGLPVPMCLFERKAVDDKKALNLALRESSQDEPQLRGIREGYVVPRKKNGADPSNPEENPYDLILMKTDKSQTLRMHNTIEDASQRPTEAVGGVYSYAAIARGSKLYGEISFSRSAAPLFSKECFSGEVRVGRSKKDDYGRARLTSGQCEAKQLNPVAGLVAGARSLLVYLESDVLVRDSCLAYSGDPRDLKRAIERELQGVTLSERPGSSGVIAAVGRARRHDSWHTKWNLPRPSLIALRAGSVYVFGVESGKLCETALQNLSLRGLGERRAEGFGRIQFNPPWLLQKEYEIQVQDTACTAGSSGDELISEEQGELLRELEIVKWRRILRRTARQKAYGMAASERGYLSAGKGPASPSQWGSLREAAARIPDDPVAGKKQLCAWADARRMVNGGNSSEDPWPKKRRDAWGKLRGKILELATQNEAVWSCYSDSNGPINVPENLKSTLWGFAVRTILDYLCEAALDQLNRKRTHASKAHAGTEAHHNG